jgi:hypothetical protein
LGRRGRSLSKDEGREIVYGMPYAEWKARHQVEATPDQLERMEESLSATMSRHCSTTRSTTAFRPVIRRR